MHFLFSSVTFYLSSRSTHSYELHPLNSPKFGTKNAMWPTRRIGFNLFFFIFWVIFPFYGSDTKMIKWGSKVNNLMDETKMKFPNDYSSDFEEDTQKKAEFGDAYDERIDPLPGFDLWQNGQKIGPTELPIVTREKSLWSTPLGTTRNGLWWQTTKKWGGSAAAWSALDENEAAEEAQTMPTTTAQRTASTTNSPTTSMGTTTSRSSSITPIEQLHAWSRSWSIGPDGHMELHIWESGKGERIEQRMLSPEERQRFLQGKQLKNVKGGEAATAKTLPATTTTNAAAQETTVKVPFNHAKSWNRPKGSISNCKVLDAAKDGLPSEEDDKSCKLTFPGIPADNNCKCTYKVAERDEKGCAVGFIYTCTRVN